MLLDNQIDIRCDRVTCENKGGVLLCVPSQMNPSNVQRFATNGIEAVSATLQLPNADSIRESVDSLYRDDTGEISPDPRTKRLKTRGKIISSK